MDQQKFAALVQRLEETARVSPGRYLTSSIMVALLGIGILGVVIGAVILSAAALAGLVALAIASGGKALIVLAKLGKLVVALAIPAWVMLKSAFTLLFSRLPEPEGRALASEEAPRLFERLDEIHRHVGGPRVHQVLLTREMNAAIVQHPRLGLFGWEKNYLILGMPMLQALSEDEAFAVVAHEYGHLSGHHGRLGGFIYRLRLAWGRLQELSENWTDWGSRLIARLFRWYAPYFNAYTFVLARQNEYLADRTSAELAGVSAATRALLRTNVAALHENEAFWPAMNQRATLEPDPPANLSCQWCESLAGEMNPKLIQCYLETVRNRRTDHFDTHPAPVDRLKALDVAFDASIGQRLEPVTRSAAEAWLGVSYQRITEQLDREWSGRVAEQWRTRHDYMQGRLARLRELEGLTSPGVDESWEMIGLMADVRPEEPLLPKVQALLDVAPDHLPARFRRGTLRLEMGDASGIDDLEAVMAQDSGAIIPGCEAAWRFYENQHNEQAAAKAEAYAARWRERLAHDEAVRAELASLPPDPVLEPETSETLREAVAEVLRGSPKHVRVAYLLRRVLTSDPAVSDHVLAFETSRLTFGEKGNETVKRLAAQEFPVPLFIVHLGSSSGKRLRGKIKAMNAEPVFSAE